jgi:hypothetical protein
MNSLDHELDNNEHSMIVITVARQSVEEGDISFFLKKLQAFTATPKRIRATRKKLCVMVEGYDSDPRELFEIPQVCAFFRVVTKQWPFWLWFLWRENNEVRNIVSLLAGGKRLQNAAGRPEFVIELSDVRRVLSGWSRPPKPSWTTTASPTPNGRRASTALWPASGCSHDDEGGARKRPQRHISAQQGRHHE